MSKILRRLLAVTLLGVASGAAASPCLPGTLSDYISLAAGCEIGTTTFAGFYVAPGETFATPIDPNLVQVTPTGSASDPGLLFTLNAAASASTLLEAFFHFYVSTGPGVSLTGARAMAGGASATGDGVALLVEDLCIGGVFAPLEPVLCSGLPDAMIAFATELDSLADASLLFGSVDFIDVFAALSVDGGLSGTAALGSGLLSFATTAAPAPEPPMLSLAAFALAVLAVVRRRQPLRAAR